jgi:NAD(P)-dependent dehydrogenase (short-subunit alcohol dehydrogenase family)
VTLFYPCFLIFNCTSEDPQALTDVPFPDLIKQTAKDYGEARVTLTSSNGYKVAPKLDYEVITTRIPDDGKSLWDVGGAWMRYVTSKLGLVYFVASLTKQLREQDIQNVYVNACHPGKILEIILCFLEVENYFGHM